MVAKDPLSEKVKSVVKIDPKTKQVKISGGMLVNPSVIRDVCDAKLKDIVFRNAERTIGVFGSPGIPDFGAHPQGQIGEVSFKHNLGKMETVFNATNLPTPPAIWEALPESSRNFLYRLEGDPPE